MTPAQNTAAYIQGFEDGKRTAMAEIKRELAKQEQGEPVAWRWGVPKLKNGKFEWRYSINKTREDAIPLYTKEQL